MGKTPTSGQRVCLFLCVADTLYIYFLFLAWTLSIESAAGIHRRDDYVGCSHHRGDRSHTERPQLCLVGWRKRHSGVGILGPCWVMRVRKNGRNQEDIRERKARAQ